jgi:MinD-like ATPase involved in chromosome partitioning or flagellar assembly
VDQAQQAYPPGTVGHLAQGRGWVKSDSETDAADPAQAPTGTGAATGSAVEETAELTPDTTARTAAGLRSDVRTGTGSDVLAGADDEYPEDAWGDDSWAHVDQIDPAAETPPRGIALPPMTGTERLQTAGTVSVPEQTRREPSPAALRHTDELESLLDAIRVPANGAGAPPHPVEPPPAKPAGTERHPSWFETSDARTEWPAPADSGAVRHPSWPDPSDVGDERVTAVPEGREQVVADPASKPAATEPAVTEPAVTEPAAAVPAARPDPHPGAVPVTQIEPPAGPEVHTDEDEDLELGPVRPETWTNGRYAPPEEATPTGYREPVVASWPEPEDPRPAEPAPPARPEEPRPAARWVEPGALAAQQAQRARTGELRDRGDLNTARLLRPARRPPRTGWRRALFALSGGLINVGEGPVDLRQRELTTEVNQPLTGCYKIAMLSLKGGVGKTTVTATLGATFASLRGDRVIAVDANPDRGTLSQKIPLETSATVRHLLRDSQRVRRYTDVRAYTSQGPSRLEVLASEQDPAVSEAFSEQDYRRTVTLLEHFYNIVLTDCGTGLMHSAMYGVLGLADALVIVSSGSIDGARSASATMDWLDAHGHGELVANSVAVINSVRRSSGQVDLDRVAEHFAARCRKVVRIPYDSHLEEGAELDLDRVAPTTRLALLELAASVADAFPHSQA